MPKEFWQIKVEGEEIFAATHGVRDSDGFYRMHWTRHRASELPNDLIGLDDLERFGIVLPDVVVS